MAGCHSEQWWEAVWAGPCADRWTNMRVPRCRCDGFPNQKAVKSPGQRWAYSSIMDALGFCIAGARKRYPAARQQALDGVDGRGRCLNTRAVWWPMVPPRKERRGEEGMRNAVYQGKITKGWHIWSGGATRNASPAGVMRREVGLSRGLTVWLELGVEGESSGQAPASLDLGRMVASQRHRRSGLARQVR